MKWVAELYPWSRSYLDVYDHFGLVRERALYAHCLYLDATDRDRMGVFEAAHRGTDRARGSAINPYGCRSQ